MKPLEKLLLTVNAALILGFGARFLMPPNPEFLIYVGVIVLALGLIGLTRGKVRYGGDTLAGLTVWSALHLAGGGVPWGAGRLYDVMLLPLSSSLPILRYDQVVHAWGFGVCAVLAHDLLRRHLAQGGNTFAIRFVCACAGMGLGAFNEVIEFLVDLALPSSGVGGYQNTALDLCANLAGASLAAFVWLPRRRVAALA
jgi:putative membrane protein